MKQAKLLRDKLREQKKFVEYKQQRNRINYLVREAKNKYDDNLAGNQVAIYIRKIKWRGLGIG